MKKRLLFIIIYLFLLDVNIVNASSGLLKSNTIVTCDDIIYGCHSSDNHCHKAKKVDDKYYGDGEIVKIPCTKSTDIVNNKSNNNVLSTEIVDNIDNSDVLSTISVDRDVVTLEKCVDGDTSNFKLNNKVVKVRYLSINAPESTTKKEFYGKEASNYVCNKLKNASKIELEYDKNSDKLDKYGRTLAWIIVDGNNLQLELVKKGYAEVKYVYGNYEYLEELKKIEKEAKKQKIGMWQNYNETIDYTNYIYIGGGIILIIICLGTKNKKSAKKIYNKLKI